MPEGFLIAINVVESKWKKKKPELMFSLAQVPQVKKTRERFLTSESI